MECKQLAEAHPNIVVRRNWNDWRTASFSYDSIGGLHWDDICGGTCVRTPQFFLHGYVFCDGMIDGEIAHSCQHGRGPHEIKVCVLKKDNRKIFHELVEGLGPKPTIMRWRKCEARKKNGKLCGCRTREQSLVAGRAEWRCRRHANQ